MPLPATGAWRRAHEYRAPTDVADEIRIDPGHEKLAQDDDPNPTWYGEPYQEAAPGPQHVGNDWVSVAPGMVLDRTPTTHDPRGDGHRVDYGADERSGRADPPLQFSTERYEYGADEGISAGAGPSETALRRGFTIDAQNNPGQASYGGHGWRPGWYHRWWVSRNFKPPPRGMVGLGRGTDAFRTVTPMTANVVMDAPPPAEPGPYNYTGDVSSLARAIRNMNRRPQLRREPEPVDDTIMTDGGGPSPFPETWVM